MDVFTFLRALAFSALLLTSLLSLLYFIHAMVHDMGGQLIVGLAGVTRGKEREKSDLWNAKIEVEGSELSTVCSTPSRPFLSSQVVTHNYRMNSLEEVLEPPSPPPPKSGLRLRGLKLPHWVPTPFTKGRICELHTKKCFVFIHMCSSE